MAVFEGARLRSDTLPAAHVAPARTRASVPTGTPVASRVRPMGLLMAAIVAATMLGLAYLTQTLGSNATSTEIRLLESKQYKMKQEIQRHEVLVLRGTADGKIRTEARRLKLTKLPAVVVLEAP